MYTTSIRLCLVLQPINIVTSGQNCRFLLMRSLTIFISGLCSIDSSSTSTWLLPQLVSLFNALSLPSVHRLFFAQQVMSVSFFLMHISWRKYGGRPFCFIWELTASSQGFYFHLVLVLSDVPHRRLVLAHHSSVSSTINVLTLPSVHRLYIARQAHFFI